jgi:release factor glutamine methyltransferase
MPGVTCPDEDTALLLDSLLESGLPPAARVLDLGVRAGQMAEILDRAGAAETLTLDLGRRSGRARLRGSRWAPGTGRFDVVVANVPFRYAGLDTQAMLHRVCRYAPRRLADDGSLWLAHSALLDQGVARRLLNEAGLSVQHVESRTVAFGPAIWSKAAALRAAGVIDADQCTEDIVLLRARRT